MDDRKLVMTISGLSVRYYSYKRPSNKDKVPLVIIVGPFRDFSSYREDVLVLARDFPIHIVEMPTFKGGDEKYTSLGSDEYSFILRRYLSHMGIKKCILLASSFNSLMAYHFASSYPHLVEKMILNGMTRGLREGVRFIIERALKQLKKKKVEQFSSNIALNFLNFGQRHQISFSDRLKNELYQRFFHSSSHERACLGAQMEQAMALEVPKIPPSCPILFVAGEFDHIMTPYDTFQVIKNCPQSTLAVVKGGDHMLGVERKDILPKLYRHYLLGLPLNQREGVEFVDHGHFPRERMRLNPRWSFDDVGFLDGGEGALLPVNIIDINMLGCRLYTVFGSHPSLSQKDSFFLRLFEENISVELRLFKQGDKGYFRGIFRHRDFEMTHKLETLIHRVANFSNFSHVA